MSWLQVREKNLPVFSICTTFASENQTSNQANKMIRLSLILLLLLCQNSTIAQRRLVVVDLETLQPVTNANVTTHDGVWRTDSTGWVSVPDKSKTLVLSHVNYEERMVNLSELRDTVFLISKLLNLKEVVVFGMDKKDHDYSQLNKRMQMDKKELQLAGMKANMNGGLNLLGLIGYLVPSKNKLSKKERKKKKLQEILDNY